MPLAVDFSVARPTRAALAEVHAVGVGRYISYPGGVNKDITAEEVQLYRSWGLDIFIYWEDQVADALGGRAKGREMAHYAAGQVVARGGPDNGGVIYACVDFDASATQMPTVLDWFRGWRDVLPVEQVGVYGGLRAVETVLDAGLAKYACQTRAWSNGIWDTRAVLQQYSWTTLSDGSQVDLLHVLSDDYGQWGAQEEPMPTAEEIAAAVWAAELPNIPADPKQLVPASRYLTTINTSAYQGMLTIQAVKAAVAALANDEAAVSKVVTDKAAVILGALAALPTTHWSDEEKAELGDYVASRVSNLDAAAVVAALGTTLVAGGDRA